MARNYKPSSIWQHRHTTIFFTNVHPFANYREEEISVEELEEMLEDATVAEFEIMFKKYQVNYFKNLNNKVEFWLENSQASNFHLLFNDDFFTLFKKDKYYCKTESLQNLNSYLVKDFYPNETEYNKAVKYIESVIPSIFGIDGRALISFEYNNNIV